MGRSLLIVLAALLVSPAPAWSTAGKQTVVPPTTRGEYLVVRPGTSTPISLHERPAGSVIRTLGTTTAFGTPRVLAVVKRRGPWLAVTTDALPNGRLGWVDARRGL